MNKQQKDVLQRLPAEARERFRLADELKTLREQTALTYLQDQENAKKPRQAQKEEIVSACLEDTYYNTGVQILLNSSDPEQLRRAVTTDVSGTLDSMEHKQLIKGTFSGGYELTNLGQQHARRTDVREEGRGAT